MDQQGKHDELHDTSEKTGVETKRSNASPKPETQVVEALNSQKKRAWTQHPETQVIEALNAAVDHCRSLISKY